MTNRCFKWFTPLLLCASLALYALFSFAEGENPPINYIDANGGQQAAVDCTLIANDTVEWSSSETQSSWYAVTENVTISSRVEVSGDVYLILCDGATMDAPKGVHLSSGNSLTIYGQSNGTGKLKAANNTNDEDGYAVIGGNDSESGGAFTINGGQVIAEMTGSGSWGRLSAADMKAAAVPSPSMVGKYMLQAM